MGEAGSREEGEIPQVAVLGCGQWGRNLIRNMGELGALAAVSDPKMDAARELASRFEVEARTVPEVLDDEAIAGVMVAAPAALHHELAAAALEAGKDVFVEKPLSLSIDDAVDLTERAKQKSAVLMVGHLMQYHPAFLEMKRLVDEGIVGRLRYVYSNRLNLGRFRQEEDILWSFAPHDISMILSLVGASPDRIRAIGSHPLGSERADVTTTHMSFPGGERAHVYVSWLHPYKEQRLVVVGDEGMAVFDDGQPWEGKLELYPHRVLWEGGVPQPVRASAQRVELQESEPLRAECEHFLDCIVNREAPRTDGNEGLRVLDVLTRAAESMVEGSASGGEGIGG